MIIVCIYIYVLLPDYYVSAKGCINKNGFPKSLISLAAAAEGSYLLSGMRGKEEMNEEKEIEIESSIMNDA